MATGPAMRADASYADRQAGAALAIIQYLAPTIRDAANLQPAGWNAMLDVLISVYGSGATPDADEVRRVLESMRAAATE